MARWNEGWWSAARAVPSPNFGPRPSGIAVNLVLIHSISLPPGCYGGTDIERLFLNQLDVTAHPYFMQIRGMQVSSHFVLRRDGELLQFVSCDERAWHAGASSWHGRPQCNDYAVGVELEGLEGDVFADVQYDALARLVGALAGQYPIEGVAGHEHVAPGRKRDPGPGFDWPRLQQGLGWPARYFPEGTLVPR